MSQDLVTLSAGENVHKQISTRLRIVPASGTASALMLSRRQSWEHEDLCRLLLLVWKSLGLYRMTGMKALNPICPADLRHISWNTSTFKSVKSSLHNNWHLFARNPIQWNPRFPCGEGKSELLYHASVPSAFSWFSPYHVKHFIHNSAVPALSYFTYPRSNLFCG